MKEKQQVKLVRVKSCYKGLLSVRSVCGDTKGG